MSKNNITGDEIKSKPNSKEFTDNWEQIFGKANIAKGKEEALKNAEDCFRNKLEANKSKVGCPNAASSTGCFCTGACKEGWDEKRIDTIGANGNTGEHYADPDAAYQQVEKDYNK